MINIKEFIDNNKWDFKIDKDKINIKIDEKYLIHYCLIYRKFDLIKEILLIDENNYEKIEYNTLVNIVFSDDFMTILNLLELVNNNGKKYILNPKYEYYMNWIVLYFMDSNIEYIKILLKYKNIIYWNFKINGFYPLQIFLKKYYNQPITNDIKNVFKIILKESNDILNYPGTSIIYDSCLTGFNKYILTKLIKFNNKLVNKLNNRHQIPLYNALTNKLLFDFLIENKADYNYSLYFDNILLTAIKTGNIYVIQKLLTFNDLNLLYYNSERNYACLTIFLKYENFTIPDEIKREILKRTNNINLQNIFGNTALHFLLLYDDWLKYKDILVTKNLDIYIKNKNGLQPINLIKNMDEFLELTTKSYYNNFKPNITINNTIEKNNKFKLYNIINKYTNIQNNKQNNNKNIKQNNNKNDILKTIQKYIIKYQESSSVLNCNINFINYDNTLYTLFNSFFTDILIYFIYLKKKYNFDIPILKLNDEYHYQETKLITNNISNKIYKNFKYLFYDSFHYINFENLNITWYNKKNFIISNNLKTAINQCNNNIIIIHLSCVTDFGLHSNCIIIDKKKKIIIRFDPNGIQKKIYHHEQLDKHLKLYFLNIFNDFVYLPPSDYMNTNSYQMLSNELHYYEVKYGDIGGFCLAWTLLFFELYMTNLHIDLSKLIETSINKIINLKGSFAEYIRRYTNVLVNFKINYLKSIDFPNDKIFSNYFTVEDENYIYKYINIEFDKMKK